MAQKILDPHYITVDKTFQECQDNFDELYALVSITKLRVVTAVEVTGAPTQDNLTHDIGMTPAAAGAGYTCVIRYPSGEDDKMMWVTSDGVNWYYVASSNSL